MSISEITVRRVLTATENEIDEITLVYCEAFGWQFFPKSITNGDKSLMRLAIRAHVTAALVGGELYIAELADGGEGKRVVGAAVWFGPGQKTFSTPEQRAVGWDDFLSKLDDTCRNWWNEFWPAYEAFAEDHFGPGVKLEAYHLQFLGVHPDEQGKGAGKKLMGAVEEKAKKEGKACCLETTKELAATKIYPSCGYSVVGEPVHGWKYANGPTEYAIWALLKKFEKV